MADRIDRGSLRTAAGAGVAAYVLGLLATLPLLALDPEIDPPVGVETIVLAGLVLFDALFVDVYDASGGAPERLDLVGTLWFPRAVYVAVPVAALVAAGAWVAARSEARTPREGLRVGASIAVGVLPAALVGRTLFTVRGDGIDVLGDLVLTVLGDAPPVAAGPGLARTVLVLGIALPVALGGLGGALAIWHRQSDGRTPDAATTARAAAAALQRRLPLRIAVLAGGGAAVAGSLATYALLAIGGLTVPGASPPTAAGWLLYDAHGVGIVRSTPAGATTVSFLADASPGLRAAIYAVPVLALVAAGVATARRSPDRPSPISTGLAVAAGYLPIALVGTVLLAREGSVVTHPTPGTVVEGPDDVLTPIETAPDLIPAVLVAGVAFPVAFAAGGVALAGARRGGLTTLRTHRRPIAAGVVAAALGIVATAALLTIDGSVDARVVVPTFVHAHGLGLVDGSSFGAVDPFVAAGVDRSRTAFFAVPVLALLVAGHLAGHGIGGGDGGTHDSIEATATAGATVALGYAPVLAVAAVVAGALVAPASAWPTLRLAPTVVLAGVVLPVAVGAIGGATAAARAVATHEFAGRRSPGEVDGSPGQPEGRAGNGPSGSAATSVGIGDAVRERWRRLIQFLHSGDRIAALAAGAVAYVAGFVVTALVLVVDRTGADRIEADLLEASRFVDLDVSWPVAIGWSFYDAQFVGLRPLGEATAETYSVLAHSATLPSPIYRAIPIVALVVAGYALGRRADRLDADRSPARAGASVALGYLPLVALGLLAFTTEGPATDPGSGRSVVNSDLVDVAIAPGPFRAILLAGIVLPIACGAVGGYLAGDRSLLRRASERIAPGHSIEASAAGGGACALLGYALTYVLLAVGGGFESAEGRLRGFEWVTEIGVDRFDLAGWVFVEAHFAEIASRDPDAPDAVSLVGSGALGVPDAAFVAIPVCLLAGAGYWIGSRADTPSIPRRALAGASIAVGYLPLAALALVTFVASAELRYFQWVEDGTGATGEHVTVETAFAPDPVWTLLLVGVAFPVVLGGIGGAVAGLRASTGGRVTEIGRALRTTTNGDE